MTPDDRHTVEVTTSPLDGAAFRRLAAQTLTYQEVGQSAADDLPGGFHHVQMSRSLGRGRELFESATDRLMTWQMHERSGLTVRASCADVQIDGLVILGIRIGPFRLTAPCRVVYVVDETARRGFAYGTLPGHPESGEEVFTIRLGADLQVTATIRAFSRPASLLARIGGPASRRIQKRATRAYLDALSE